MRSRLALVALLLFSRVAAQERLGFDPSLPNQQFNFDQWSGENGLVSNNLTSVLHSRTGFLWMTTYNGLMRFDGKRLEVFDRSTHPFFHTDAFYRAYEDSQGTIWIASQGTGIVRIKNDSITRFLPNNKLLPLSIRSIHFDTAAGVVWAGSNNSGLYTIRDTVVNQLRHPWLDDQTILSLHTDPKGKLWIATDGGGLVTYEKGKFERITETEGLVSNAVNAVNGFDDGTIVVGTAIGVNLITNGKIEIVPEFRDHQINYLLIDDFQNLWLACEKGLGRIHRDHKLTQFWNEHDLAVPLSRINSLAFDQEGSMWIATGRSGLLRAKQGIVRSMGTREGLSFWIVNCVTEKDGAYFIGTDDGTIDRWTAGSIEHIPIYTDLKAASIRDIAFDEAGVMWVATYLGVLKKDGRNESLLTMKTGLPANDFRRVLIDSKGIKWLGSRSGGLVKMKGDKVEAVYNRTNQLSSNYILAVEEGRDGSIYAGTHSGGLSIVSPSGAVRTHHIRNDDSGVLIFNLHIDDNDRVWIVCNLGLFFFDGTSFKPIALEDIPVGATFFDWVEDRSGNVWVTTNVGVLKMQKSHLLDFIEGKIAKVGGRIYDDSDGMNHKEATGATRSLVSSGNEVWVPTIKGVSIFAPDEIRKNERKPPVYITHIQVDKSNEVARNGMKIPPGAVRHLIRFTALSLLAPDKVKLKYQLKGVDKDWIDAGSERHAEYTNLSPGDYEFAVIACNNDGVWNNKGATLRFTIQPFFYQTWQFYAVLILLFAASIYLIFWLRVRAIERRNRELRKVNSELDRFVYSASHDLRAPLTSILGLVNVFRLDSSSENKSMYLDKIEQSVRKLDSFIHDIIDFSRNARLEIATSKIDFEKMFHDIVEDLKYLDRDNRIERRIIITGTGEFFTDPKRLRVVLSNLLSNAFRYHNLSQSLPFIEMEVEILPHEALIKVKDNGKGISPEHIDHIFKMFYRADEDSKGSGLGLYIVKETLEKIKGYITVDSVLHQGTTFELRLPSIQA